VQREHLPPIAGQGAGRRGIVDRAFGVQGAEFRFERMHGRTPGLSALLAWTETLHASLAVIVKRRPARTSRSSSGRRVLASWAPIWVLAGTDLFMATNLATGPALCNAVSVLIDEPSRSKNFGPITPQIAAAHDVAAGASCGGLAERDL
jgi:hypothetical protein